MNKREAELQRCLEKTLAITEKGLRDSSSGAFTALYQIQECITRTLRKGK